MQTELVAWVRAQPLWVRAAVGVLAALAVVYLLPLILVPEAGLDEAEKRLKAENDLRTTLVQAAGGAIVLLGTWRTLHINREGQITERFTRAIDQLGQTGEEKLDVRLGGIYALERIGRDSESDRGPISEVLTAFLREHARWKSDNPDTQAVTGGGEDGSGNEQRPRLRADFQAAATVLGRNQWSGQHRFDLREVDLRHANVGRAHLKAADLRFAHLEGVNLARANLEGVDFTGAHPEGANLSSAHLKGAVLFGTHLERANLLGAHLEAADLRAAHLERAKLARAHLEGAFLTGAHLEGAILGAAHLEGANLSSAHLEGVVFILAHLNRADFTAAHLERALLTGAHLERADFTRAHLEGALLFGADLQETNFTGAHLDGVIGLTTSQLEGVIGLSEATGVPPGLLGT